MGHLTTQLTLPLNALDGADERPTNAPLSVADKILVRPMSRESEGLKEDGLLPLAEPNGRRHLVSGQRNGRPDRGKEALDDFAPPPSRTEGETAMQALYEGSFDFGGVDVGSDAGASSFSSGEAEEQKVNRAVSIPRVFRFGEFFSGPGGLALAAKTATVGGLSMQHAWAVDYHEDTVATYRRNICPGEPEKVHCADIRKFDLSKLGDVDAFLFGFPCNDYSTVGEQKGMMGTYGPLYSYGAQLIREKKPLWFLAENVSGLSSTNDGSDLIKIIEDLKAIGYVVTAHLYPLELYGVPQARRRIIMIGIRDDLGLEFKVPAPMDAIITCQEAICNPPIQAGAHNHDLTRQSEVVVERLKHIKPGQNAWTADLPEHLKLNVKGARMSQIYRRLDPDKPAYTLTASGGGGTHVYHWSENRALTNRERARLQTFPDDFIFEGSKETIRRQIGMAVPPTGAKSIMEAVLKTFAGVAYPSIPASIGVFRP